MKPRVSLVDYLNAAPLGWAFLRGPLRNQFEIRLAPPSGCADLLASGEVDIGLIPSIEYQRIPGLAIIPDIAIAAVDYVRSVVMVQPRGRRVRSVALDTSSRTSVVLLRLLLRHRLGLEPEFVPMPPDPDLMLGRCDAALLIGDSALRLPRADLEILDLARAWIDWQGSPFVFAFWACRMNSRPDPEIAAIFREAKRWGLDRRPEIAETYAHRLGLPLESLQAYLTRNIDYDMGSWHIRGLNTFYEAALEFLHKTEPDPLHFVPAATNQEAWA